MRSRFRVAFPWVLLGLGGSVLAAVIACSSSSATVACNEDPFQCAAGTTCWPSQCVCPTGQQCDITNCVPQFSCVASVPGKQVADSCHNTTGTDSATCGDLQACIELGGNPAGLCAAYCDPSSPTHGCSGDDICSVYRVGSGANNPTINVCVPKPTRDGGPDPFALDGSAGGDDGSFDGELYVPPDAMAEAQPHNM
jgi:hypothetical protein